MSNVEKVLKGILIKNDGIKIPLNSRGWGWREGVT